MARAKRLADLLTASRMLPLLNRLWSQTRQRHRGCWLLLQISQLAWQVLGQSFNRMPACTVHVV